MRTVRHEWDCLVRDLGNPLGALQHAFQSVSNRLSLYCDQLLRGSGPGGFVEMLERALDSCSGEFEPFIRCFADAFIQSLARLRNRRNIAGRLLRGFFRSSPSQAESPPELIGSPPRPRGRQFGAGFPNVTRSFHSALEHVEIRSRRTLTEIGNDAALVEEILSELAEPARAIPSAPKNRGGNREGARA